MAHDDGRTSYPKGPTLEGRFLEIRRLIFSFFFFSSPEVNTSFDLCREIRGLKQVRWKKAVLAKFVLQRWSSRICCFLRETDAAEGHRRAAGL